MSPETASFLKLKVISLEKLLVDEEIKEISLPSLDGYLGILPGHRNMLVALGKGDITYKLQQIEKSVSIQGGYAKIFSGQVLVFAEFVKNETDKSDEESG